MRPIPAHEITKGTLLFITLKNGARVNGRAMGRTQAPRGISWYITVKPPTRGRVRVEGADIATICTVDEV